MKDLKEKIKRWKCEKCGWINTSLSSACRNCNTSKSKELKPKDIEDLKEKIIEILEEELNPCDGGDFNDWFEDFSIIIADQILELLEEEKKKWVEEIEDIIKDEMKYETENSLENLLSRIKKE